VWSALSVSPRQKREWSLNQEAFDALLVRLHPDREQSGVAYECVRNKLLKFFDWRGCHSTADHADEVINRVARRIQEGEHIHDLPSYFLGTARLLLLEIHRRPKSVEIDADRVPSPPPAEADRREVAEERFRCLEECLGKLTNESRQLISEYYEGHPSKKSERERLGERLGIPMNALRIRVHRVRIRLEECVETCLERTDVEKQNPRVPHYE
jgi:DNA-directed RNA polymerase specialized sigma24 family protein